MVQDQKEGSRESFCVAPTNFTAFTSWYFSCDRRDRILACIHPPAARAGASSGATQAPPIKPSETATPEVKPVVPVRRRITPYVSPVAPSTPMPSQTATQGGSGNQQAAQGGSGNEQTVYQQQCAAGPCASGPNSQAIQNGPPKLIMTTKQVTAIQRLLERELGPFKGTPVSLIATAPTTDDSAEFTANLEQALRDGFSVNYNPNAMTYQFCSSPRAIVWKVLR